MQIPYVQWLMDSTLFPNDPLASTFDRYIGPVWDIVAYMAKFASLETILLVFFLLSRALVLFAAARLSLAIIPESNLAAVGAMGFFALVPPPVIGHGTLVINYFEHTGLSVAFLLLATGAFYSKKRYWWAVLFAAAFNLNILYGFYACLYFAAVFSLLSEYRKNWKKWLLPALLFVLLSLITILPTARAAIDSSGFDRELWLKASRLRHPFHIYPHTWDPLAVAVFCGFTLVAGAVMLLHWNKTKKLSRFGLIWLGVCLLWLGLALFAAYIARSPTLLILQSTRGTDLWFAFAAVAVIGVFASQAEKNDPYQRMFALLFFVSVLWLNFFFFRQITLLVWLFLTLLVLLNPTWSFFKQTGISSSLSIMLVLIVLVFGGLSLSNRYENNLVSSMVKRPHPQIVELAEWANQNTPPETVFLVDPNWEEFRGLSERGVFVAWKEGTAIFWDPGFVGEWVERIETFGFDFDNSEPGTTKGSNQLSRLFEKMEDNTAELISIEYPVRYWITAVDKATQFEEVYRTERFKILKLNP